MPFVKKDFCVRGHKLHAKNIYLRPDGLGKHCKTCNALREAKRRAKIKRIRFLMEEAERMR